MYLTEKVLTNIGVDKNLILFLKYNAFFNITIDTVRNIYINPDVDDEFYKDMFEVLVEALDENHKYNDKWQLVYEYDVYLGIKKDFFYDEEGRIVKIISSTGSVTEFFYKGSDYVQVYTSSERETIIKKYVDNKIVLYADSDGDFVTFEYLDNVRKVYTKDRTYIDTMYDSKGNEVIVSNAGKNPVYRVYNDKGQIIKKISNNKVETWEFDEKCRLIKHKKANGAVYKYNYEGNNIYCNGELLIKF